MSSTIPANSPEIPGPATTALRLRMFAGPNGSGKTTIARQLSRELNPNGVIHLGAYVNADDVLRLVTSQQGVDLVSYGVTEEWDGILHRVKAGGRLPAHDPFLRSAVRQGSILNATDCSPYAAAAICDAIRDRLLEQRASFSFETVMSHSSKTEFFCRAHRSGYRTYLYFVATQRIELNLERIAERVAQGEHSVPLEKVIERSSRTFDLLPQAVACADRSYFFDNSETPRLVAEVTPNRMLVAFDQLPMWLQDSQRQFGLRDSG